ncbi:hypothetical protein FRZ67_19090 [Panacibacter ginsenosidivorans]|uniref:Methylamine utilisation protein MauE domain-containing protein n=1 Tax=Panacibacter ginsenosidivorans TaxID=1813871 RepID=A0A5B8VDF7_9BACT|nr:MauE/DoxX family redox-associated membrane protein [Panacibacter ginsenosidivorans]QEC69309.1 hypothetical protein FRZ67_19090 [Panacibacter ginsenosidivorans]
MRFLILQEAIASLLALVFVYASVSKLIDFSNFNLQLHQSPFLNPLAWWIARLIPSTELIIAGLLIIKTSRLQGLFASVFLMSLFTAYLIAMLHFSDYLPCTCGGLLEVLSWDTHVVFNIVLLILSITGIVLFTPAKPAINGTTGSVE